MAFSHISAVALVVADYDEAVDFYVGKLGFELCEDARLDGGKRWVTISPAGGREGCRLLLAKAVDDAQRRAIGSQSGGRVFLFLTTDDFDRDHARMKAAGVVFCETPRREVYGKVAVFEDLYGNRWDLIEPSNKD